MKHYSKLYSLCATLCLLLSACHSNTNDWSKIKYDTNLHHPLFDEQHWEYPWYIIKDDEGNFSSSFSDTITAADTVHVYYTAACTTNHQGEHEVNYCVARRTGDTLQLQFVPPLPAYWGDMTITLTGNRFKAQFGGEPFMSLPSIQWKTLKQELTLNSPQYLTADSIKGVCHIEFEETVNDSLTAKFYFTGAFKTKVE